MRILLLILVLFFHLPKGQAQNAHGYYENSLNMYNSGNPKQALGEINKLIEQDPENVDGLYLRAYIYLNTDQKQKALTDYSKILRMVPHHVGISRTRSLKIREEKNSASPYTVINKCIAMQPKTRPAGFNRPSCNAFRA